MADGVTIVQMPDRRFADEREREVTLADIVDALGADNLISDAQQAQLAGLHSATAAADKHPLQRIAESQILPDFDLDKLCRWYAARVDLAYEAIDPLRIDYQLLAKTFKKLSASYALRHYILPLREAADKLIVAVAQPYLFAWENQIALAGRCEIQRVFANPEIIIKCLNYFNSGFSGSFDKAIAESGGAAAISSHEKIVELGKHINNDGNNNITGFVDAMFQYAFDEQASDIHFEPFHDASRVRFRIDGVLHMVHQMPPASLSAAISRIKTLGRMDITERRRPQDGRIKTKTPEGAEVELRLSTVPTPFGEKLVVRTFDPKVLVREFNELGLTADDEHLWNRMIRQPHGIVIVTGPTGSGKTTTLYSAIRQLASPEINIATIEDPIEQVDRRFTQVQVNPEIGLDFVAGIRALLRQDPDIMMIGEIRDKETADAAIQAALTGHLVITTMHTNDAASTITRFLDLGIPPYLIKTTLIGAVAQRLVRKLCPQCRQPGAIAESDWKALVQPLQIDCPEQIFTSQGCEACRNSGFRGRLAIFEFLLADEQVKQLITHTADVAAIRQRAIAEGMISLHQNGAFKIREGVTSLEEILRVVPLNIVY